MHCSALLLLLLTSVASAYNTPSAHDRVLQEARRNAVGPKRIHLERALSVSQQLRRNSLPPVTRSVIYKPGPLKIRGARSFEVSLRQRSMPEGVSPRKSDHKAVDIQAPKHRKARAGKKPRVIGQDSHKKARGGKQEKPSLDAAGPKAPAAPQMDGPPHDKQHGDADDAPPSAPEEVKPDSPQDGPADKAAGSPKDKAKGKAPAAPQTDGSPDDEQHGDAPDAPPSLPDENKPDSPKDGPADKESGSPKDKPEGRKAPAAPQIDGPPQDEENGDAPDASPSPPEKSQPDLPKGGPAGKEASSPKKKAEGKKEKPARGASKETGPPGDDRKPHVKEAEHGRKASSGHD